jgi:hypothetical protein
MQSTRIQRPAFSFAPFPVEAFIDFFELANRLLAYPAARLDEPGFWECPVLSLVFGFEVGERRQPVSVDGSRKFRVSVPLVQLFHKPIGRLAVSRFSVGRFKGV